MSRCGQILASSSHDEVVKFWNVDTDSIKRLSKQRAGKRKGGASFKSSNAARSRSVHAASAACADFFADLAPSSNSGQTVDNGVSSDDSDDESDDDFDDSDSD